MSISAELSRILKQAGVDPSLYDTDRPGFRKDFQPFADEPHNIDPDYRQLSKEKTRTEKPKSKTLDVGPLQEFHDPQTRIQAIKSQDEDRGLKLIYQWTKSGSVKFDEFEDLMAEIVRKIHTKL